MRSQERLHQGNASRDQAAIDQVVLPKPLSLKWGIPLEHCSLERRVLFHCCHLLTGRFAKVWSEEEG